MSAFRGCTICVTGDKSFKNRCLTEIRRFGGNCTFEMDNSVTHVISDNPTDKICSEAWDLGIPIQSSTWIHSVVVRAIHEPTFKAVEVAQNHLLKPFQNIAICSTNLASTEKSHLRDLVTNNGGQWLGSLDPDCKILIAEAKHGPKVEKAQELGMPIVRKTWLLECVDRKRWLDPILIPWTDPNASSNSQKYRFKVEHVPRPNVPMIPTILSASDSHTMDREVSPHTPKLEPGIFSNRCFYIDGFPDQFVDAMKKEVISHGGRVVDYLYDPLMVTYAIVPFIPDIYPYQIPMKDLKSQLSRGNLYLVTPYWVENCIEANMILDTSLHPTHEPRHDIRIPLVDFEQFVCFVTGLSPTQVTLFSKLLKQLGAKVEKKFTENVNLVLQKENVSNKHTRRALEQGIRVETEVWLYKCIEAQRDAHRPSPMTMESAGMGLTPDSNIVDNRIKSELTPTASPASPRQSIQQEELQSVPEKLPPVDAPINDAAPPHPLVPSVSKDLDLAFRHATRPKRPFARHNSNRSLADKSETLQVEPEPVLSLGSQEPFPEIPTPVFRLGDEDKDVDSVVQVWLNAPAKVKEVKDSMTDVGSNNSPKSDNFKEEPITPRQKRRRMDTKRDSLFFVTGAKDADKVKLEKNWSRFARYTLDLPLDPDFAGLIVYDPISSCKVLCAMAAGRPLLRPDWVDDCCKNGRLMELDTYRWTTVLAKKNKSSKENICDVAIAWCEYFKAKPGGAFKDWNILVLCEKDYSYATPIIKSGGGQCHEMDPTKTSQRLPIGITHVVMGLAESSMARWPTKLVEQYPNVPVVKPTCLVEILRAGPGALSNLPDYYAKFKAM